MNLDVKENLETVFDQMFPLCRSITGEGYRASFAILKKFIPFKEIYYETGKQVLNWSIPEEWVIRKAFIKSLDEDRIIVDFNNNCLHLLNYSTPVNKIITLDELKQHLYVSKTDPSSIPYVFSYYKRRWGFAVTQTLFDSLKEGLFQVYVDSEFVRGTVLVGETTLTGTSNREILLSSYLCHPSMANNELSGPLVLAMLYQRISRWKNRKFTYRFVINPETIGSISYLSDHGQELKSKMFAGMVLTTLGGKQNLRWKASRSGNSPFDHFVNWQNHLKPGSFRYEDFDPSEGSDERQYCSPGFDLPVGQMARLVYGTYKEYHTSNDTKELMGIDNIIDSCNKLETFLQNFEKERFCINKFPYGEVKLSDYELYPDVNSDGNRYVSFMKEPKFVAAVMTILNYADGMHSLSFVSMKTGLSTEFLNKVADILKEKGLTDEI